MTLDMHWETSLLARAHEAFASRAEEESVPGCEKALANAYTCCEQVTQEHSRTFYLASGLLPGDKRRAVRALYAFCRVSDDLVDRGGAEAAASLAAWRGRALSRCPSNDDPVALAWADTRTRYRIPARYAEQLLDGVAADLVPRRYATFEALTEYCYGVASTVGLMAMHIIGFAGPQALGYAIKLGVALQLTNILRDVGEDWRMGRLYLPLDELAAFGLSEADVDAGVTAHVVDARWRAFMDFQIERTRQLYAESMPGIALLDAQGRFAIAAAAELYRAILDDIQAHGGDVFSRRAHVHAWGKLRRLPSAWWRSYERLGVDAAARVS